MFSYLFQKFIVMLDYQNVLQHIFIVCRWEKFFLARSCTRFPFEQKGYSGTI